MEVRMRPVSPSDTNKENIVISQNTTSVVSHSNSGEEIMDYSEASDVEKDSLDLSTVPTSQEDGLLLSDQSDSEIPKDKNTVGTGSEPEDGELTYDTEFPDDGVENWGPVRASAEKLAERAKRFGLNSYNVPISKEELLKLYESLNIPLNLVRSGKLRNIRLDTLHMVGVQEMKTKDVSKYFENYQPMFVEWINDFSCNVIFASDACAAKAIMELSSEIITGEKASKDPLSTDHDSKKDTENLSAEDMPEWKKKQSSSDDSAGKAKSIAALFETPVPPGKWRMGRPCEKADTILLRFAMKDNIPGLISNSQKRKFPAYPIPFQRDHDEFLKMFTEKYSRNSDNSGIGDDTQRRTVEFRGRRAPRSRRYADRFPSPLYRTDRQDWSSDSDDEQNILSAGGKKIRMRMYADEVEGSWQKVNVASGSVPTTVHPKPVHQVPASNLSDASSDEDKGPRRNAGRKDVPSRYKIWNPIAENMAREAELAEKSQGYGFSRYQRSYVDNDLRSKIRVASAEEPSYVREVTKCHNEGDLRRKLLYKRKRGSGGVPVSPLLISVRNKKVNDGDNSL